jgi:hypothetical protein
MSDDLPAWMHKPVHELGPSYDDLVRHYRSVDGRPTLWNDVFFTDPCSWPRFVLFPRLERARIAAQDARTRVRDAWSVLRGHETVRGEWEDA